MLLLIFYFVFVSDDDYLRDGTLNKHVDWISGMSNIRYKDLPNFIRTSDPNDVMFDFMGEEAQSCLKAPAILFNTFDEFEDEALEAIKNKFKYPNNIYTIGPLSLLGKHFPSKGKIVNLNSSLWKADPNVPGWLDTQDPSSVVYVNYGSIAKMTRKHLVEFAWGLANSKQRFLWIIRPDIVEEEEEEEAGETTSLLLPDDFLEEVKGRGMVTSWCAQDQILTHPAIGAFLCHCGWNSMTETVCAGVPVICWPYFADQQTNCHYSCEKWRIGMEMNHDVKREEVAEIVCRMMTGEEGHQMRKNAREWKKMAEEATDIGGSSYVNFHKLVKEALGFRGYINK